MKKYLSFFRLRFSMGLQYRVAAFAGLVTQFAWGGMLILAYRAFYRADPNAFPMTFQATATYVWLQQAFLMLFQPWGFEYDILEAISSGSVAYELCRPVSVYNMWFARTVATRASATFLRCWPVLILGALLPAPYGISAPSCVQQLLWALLSGILGMLVSSAICMLVYFSTFYTVNSTGVRTICLSYRFSPGICHPLALHAGWDPPGLGASALCRHLECSPADLFRRYCRNYTDTHGGSAVFLAWGAGGGRKALGKKRHEKDRDSGRLTENSCALALEQVKL